MGRGNVPHGKFSVFSIQFSVGEKLQAPTSKLQRSSNFQAPKMSGRVLVPQGILIHEAAEEVGAGLDGETGGAGFDQAEGGLGFANQPGGFDADGFSQGFTEEFDFFDGGFGAVEIGGGGDVLDAGIEGEFTGENDFFAGEQVGFEDGFDEAFVGGFGKVAEFAEDVLMIAIFETAEVDDDVEFMRAVVNGSLDFVALGVGIERAQGEADESDDLDFGIVQEGAGEFDAGGVDADGVIIIFAGFGAEFFEVGAGGGGGE